MKNDMFINDDGRICWGDSNELQIYHSGSHGWIKNTQGYTHICAAYVELKNAADNETMLLATQNSGVKLYHNDNLKLETHTFGVQIEMSPRMDLYGTGNAIELKFITNSGTHRGSVYADNGNTIGFLKAGTGSWAARWHSDGKQTAHGAIWPTANNSYNLGDGSYRWNNAYIKKLSLNTSNTNSQLTINSDSSANAISIRNTTGGNGNVGILFSTQDHPSGREKAAIYHQETHGQAHYGGDFIFCLNTATGSAGQVGPGDVKLRVNRNGAALAVNTSKAYGNFNQTNHGARRNYNIQSYTDYGTGQTRVTFTTALAADYIVTTGGSRDQPESSRCYPSNIDAMTTTHFEITNHNDGSTNVDWALMMFTCHGAGGG